MSSDSESNVDDHLPYSSAVEWVGELEYLKEMPVDILLEIFGNLDPISLLHLSRASTGLRNIITSSNAIYLWHLSYDNIQRSCPRPPSCPADTNIISYTKFLYQIHCQFCGSDNDIFYHFHALVRFCRDCFRAGLLVESDCPDIHSQKFRRLHNRRLVVKREYNRRQRERSAAIYNNTFGEYMSHRTTIVLDRERVYSFTSFCLGIIDEEDGIAFQLASQLRQWKDRFESWRLRKLLIERKRDIRRKLRTEGYGEEVNKFTIVYLPHVNETKPLTDFEWINIRADIMDSLLDLSEEDEIRKLTSRLLVILKWMHTTIHNELEVHRCKIPPTIFHIASSQPFLEYIEQDMLGGTLFESQLHEFVMTWRREMDEYLASLLPDHDHATNPRRPLELATTFFTCSSCAEPISYPRILMHDCMIQVPISGSLNDGGVAVPEVTAAARSPCRPRQPRPRRVIDRIRVLQDMRDNGSGTHVGKSGVGVTFNKAAYTAARRVVLAFGEDPKAVTSVEMENRNGRIECRRCFHGPQHPPKHRKLVMTWTQAILHDLQNHYWKNRPHEAVWRVICSHTERGNIGEIESQRAISEGWYLPPACVHKERFDGPDDIRAHLAESIDFSMHGPPHPVRHSPLKL